MFLPITPRELKTDSPDFILVTGDAYVDHPSYGAAIIGRLLENMGFTVAVLPQPDWKDISSFTVFGMPRLAFLVTGGNIDSMVNNYTVALKRREKDVYSAGAQAGKRPDRAAIVYSNKIREAYKDAAIILGGLEASLRRLSHYDYWDNKIRRSVLLDSSADLLVYGMGEHQMREIAERLNCGERAENLTDIRGTVYKTKIMPEITQGFVVLPSFAEVSANKQNYAESFKIQYENTDFVTGKTLIEPYNGVYVVQNPPAKWLDEKELDEVYEYPYEKTYHPAYEGAGGVPAITEVEFSVTSCRGCFGSCNFCALSFHQGRVVSSRSHKSIVAEAESLTKKSGFKGYIHDVGGPSANFRFASCEGQLTKGACKNKKCLFPAPCKNMKVSHADYLNLLRKLRNLSGVKKVFVRSGIRFDYVIADKNDEFFRELVTHHVSGQLKVAPEHVSKTVLDKMGKPNIEVFNAFKKKFEEINRQIGKEQYLVPYFISSHPGSGLKEAVELAEYLKGNRIRPEQVQDFYPTPGTLSTCMYYTETDCRSGEKINTAKTKRDKSLQRALMQYFLPQNYRLVKDALIAAGREDLIGYGAKCLIKPDRADFQKAGANNKGANNKDANNKGVNKKGAAKGLSGGKGFNESKETNGKIFNAKSDAHTKKKKKTIRNVHKPAVRK
ncbi:MAG: YgiQ family radical SAM protein [Clostridiales bacterium]|jgi:uncharacterized radical SAM protein YgiQ|nr:YgiQ family radical SAM protein [Clostridiales bacterium]